MLGAVNMGRGMAFQARTGVRARNQPGRQLGVSGGAGGGPALPCHCWRRWVVVGALKEPVDQHLHPSKPSLHSPFRPCVQNLAEMAVFRRANEGVAQAARVTEEVRRPLLCSAGRARRHLPHAALLVCEQGRVLALAAGQRRAGCRHAPRRPRHPPQVRRQPGWLGSGRAALCVALGPGPPLGCVRGWHLRLAVSLRPLPLLHRPAAARGPACLPTS